MKSNSIWQDEAKLREAVANSNSIGSCIAYLNLARGGATYKRFVEACGRFSIPLDFPDNYRWWQTIPLEKIMVENSPYTNNRIRLKQRIIEAGLLAYECSECGLGPEWNGKTLVLQLDHINGVNNDHRLENLRILCPNCHTQTATYAGKRRDHNG